MVPFKRTVKHTPLADQLEMYNVSDDPMGSRTWPASPPTRSSQEGPRRAPPRAVRQEAADAGQRSGARPAELSAVSVASETGGKLPGIFAREVTAMDDTKAQLLRWIDEDREEII